MLPLAQVRRVVQEAERRLFSAESTAPQRLLLRMSAGHVSGKHQGPSTELLLSIIPHWEVDLFRVDQDVWSHLVDEDTSFSLVCPRRMHTSV